MTDKEVEVVAEELAKIGGVPWYPGRERGPLIKVVKDRFRVHARVAIAAIDRSRAPEGTRSEGDATGVTHIDKNPQPLRGEEVDPVPP